MPDTNDSIYGSDDDGGEGEMPSSPSRRNPEMLSDLPALKRRHMTDGYREGLTVSKAQHMQDGFDAGYPIGIQIGQTVGEILGIFEGYLVCPSIESLVGLSEILTKTYIAAKRELAISELLKGYDDESLARMETIPEEIVDKIEYWSGVTYGVLQTKEKTLQILYQGSSYNFREFVLAANAAKETQGNGSTEADLKEGVVQEQPTKGVKGGLEASRFATPTVSVAIRRSAVPKALHTGSAQARDVMREVSNETPRTASTQVSLVDLEGSMAKRGTFW